MCTVTLIARRNGYALGMNRDEKLTRATALPPARHRFGQVNAVFPSEPGGGTWIGVNNTGAALALINWYSVAARASGQPVSRGEIVRRTLSARSASEVDSVLRESPLPRVNPFRLIGVFPRAKEVIEWCWNLENLERLAHPWQHNTWISSGWDEPGAQQTRSKTFAKALQQPSAGRLDWLRRLHRSHLPERGPYSTCMHRADAATLSYTEITVTPGTVRMLYHAGAPCCRGRASTIQLKR